MTCDEALALLDASSPEAQAHLARCSSCQQARASLQRADEALRLLRERPASSRPPPFSMALLGAARSGVRAQRWRQRFRRAARPFLALTATALMAIAAERLLHGHAVHQLEVPGDALAVSPAGAVTEAVTAGGASIWVDRPGELQLLTAGPAERIRLVAGSARFEVRKLAEGTSFAVETAHADVVVHGTRFTVATGRDMTRVSVLEGRVEVQPRGAARPATLLMAGEHLEVPSVAMFQKGLSQRAEEFLARGEWDEALHTLDETLRSQPSPGFEGPARARRALVLSAKGENAAALEEYDRALTFVPGTQAPLWADNAAAERAVLLERVGRQAEAVAAWLDYLRRFPKGVHSALARERGAESGR